MINTIHNVSIPAENCTGFFNLLKNWCNSFVPSAKRNNSFWLGLRYDVASYWLEIIGQLEDSNDWKKNIEMMQQKTVDFLKILAKMKLSKIYDCTVDIEPDFNNLGNFII